MYMILASRHYPTVYIRFGERLTLEDQQDHAEDVAKYVQRYLCAGSG